MALVALVVGVPGFAQAQDRLGVGVVTALVGEASVARAAAEPQNLRMRDGVFPKDRITTGERSMVHVLLGGKALLTVRELSVVTVTEDGSHAIVDLQSGKVGLAVVRERMKPGELIEVQTPHAVAAVRGTVLVVEIVPGQAGGDQQGGESSTNVHLLHGKLDVSLRGNPGVPPIQLESLQTVSATRNVLGAMRPLSPAAASAVTTGLRPAQPASATVPEKFQAAVSERQRGIAVATLEDLAAAGRVRVAGKATRQPGQKGKGTDPGVTQEPVALAADVADVPAQAAAVKGLTLSDGAVRASALALGQVGAVGGGKLAGPIVGPGIGAIGIADLAPIAPVLLKKLP
jgi:hypothetical protein